VTDPDFLVIGAYKSGTTALHHHLRAHPGLFLPERKEPNHFAFAGDTAPFTHPAAAGSVRDRSSYDALFAGAPAGSVIGEVSPAYLAVPGSCDRIRAALPAVRLVAVLRNPVERAYSDFLMYRRDGTEPEPAFLHALERQSARDAATDPTSRYVSTGFYAQQLEPYLQAFPRERLHLLLHEDLRDDREPTLAGLFEFLGVDPDVALDEQPPANVSGEPGSAGLRLAYAVRRRVRDHLRPVIPAGLKRRVDAQLERRLVRAPMPPDARARLIDTYREDVLRLAAILDRDLTSWLEP
jgi:hypothetical protein